MSHRKESIAAHVRGRNCPPSHPGRSHLQTACELRMIREDLEAAVSLSELHASHRDFTTHQITAPTMLPPTRHSPTLDILPRASDLLVKSPGPDIVPTHGASLSPLEYTLELSEDPVKQSQGIHVLSSRDLNLEMYYDDAKDKVLVAIVKALLMVGNRPMAPKEISHTILRLKLTPLGGATPYATVSSRISQHFKRAAVYKPNGRPPILGRLSVDEKQTRKLRYFVAQAGISVGLPFTSETSRGLDNESDTAVGMWSTKSPAPVDGAGAGAGAGAGMQPTKPESTKRRSLLRKSYKTESSDFHLSIAESDRKSKKRKTSNAALTSVDPPAQPLRSNDDIPVASSASNEIRHRYGNGAASRHTTDNIHSYHYTQVFVPLSSAISQGQHSNHRYHPQSSNTYPSAPVQELHSRPAFSQGGGKSLVPLLLAAEALLGDDVDSILKHKRLARQLTTSSYADEADDDEYIGTDGTDDSGDELYSSGQPPSSVAMPDVKSFDWEGSRSETERTRDDSGEWVLGAPNHQSPRAPRNMGTVPSPWRSFMYQEDANDTEDPLSQSLQTSSQLSMLSPRGWRDIRPPESISVTELDRLWGDRSIPRHRHRMNSNDWLSPRRTPRIHNYSHAAPSPALERLQKTPYELFGPPEGEQDAVDTRRSSADTPEKVAPPPISHSTSDEGRKRGRSVIFGGQTPATSHNNPREQEDDPRDHNVIQATQVLNTKRPSSASMVADSSPKRPSPIDAHSSRRRNSEEPSPMRTRTPRRSSNTNATETPPLTPLIPLEQSPPAPMLSKELSFMESVPDPPVDVDPAHLKLHLPLNPLPCTSPPIYLTSIDGVGLYITWLKTYPHQQRGVPLMRRVDSDLVHGATLLFAGGMITERERSIVLSLERGRVRFKIPESPLSGTWVSLYRARGLASSCCLDAVLELLLSDDLNSYFDPALLSCIQPSPRPPLVPLMTPYIGPSSCATVTRETPKAMSPLSYFASTLAVMLAAQQAAQQKGLPIPELSYSPSKDGLDEEQAEGHSSEQSSLAAFIEAFKQAKARKAAGQSDSLLPTTGSNTGIGAHTSSANRVTSSLPPTDIASIRSHE
ncbi:hypothetical protein SeLEV6574_g06377 [Synchytrium endobioticum]|nr:hypothetical protein SeLEV6574_g06377 [Synchytrium endobioticum]